MDYGNTRQKLLSILKNYVEGEIEGIGIPTKGVPQGGILSLYRILYSNELIGGLAINGKHLKNKNEYSTLGSKHRALKNTNLKRNLYC